MSHAVSPQSSAEGPTPRRPQRSALWLVAGAVSLAAACDNPTCLFGENGCGSTGANGGLGEAAASTPFDGATILPGEPRIDAVFPQGSTAHPDTLIVLEVSESLDAKSVDGAFELLDASFGNPIDFMDPPPVIANGRLVLLIPDASIPPGTPVLVRHAGGGRASDLTGQLLSTATEEIADFVIASNPSDDPRLLTSFPRSGTSDQSDVGFVSFVFDRPVDSSTVSDQSFLITVDGIAPLVYPDPAPLVLDLGGGPMSLQQVYGWEPLNADSSSVTYAAGAQVEIEFSPDSSPVLDDDGDRVAATMVDYSVSDVPSPESVFKVFEPTDAIGTPDVDGVAPILQVVLPAPAQTADGDVLELFLFGNAVGETPVPIALLHSLPIAAVDAMVEVSPEQLQLRDSEGEGVLAEGDVAVAARFVRGSVFGALRVLDSAVDVDGKQGLIFDLTPPEITGLGPQGAIMGDYVTDLGGFVISGLANEEVRAVTVNSTALALDNGTNAAVAAASTDGLFVARGIDGVHLIDPTLAVPDYSVEVFDRALNPAAMPLVGLYSQRGIVGPTIKALPTRVIVRVFDALTLEWLPGARVMSFDDTGASAAPLNFDFTDDDGNAEVLTALMGETVVAVELNGYDLFTFDGLVPDRIEIPLYPIGSGAGADTNGTVFAPSGLGLASETNLIGDARFAGGGEPLQAVDACLVGPDEQSCGFGPFAIEANVLGAQSFLSVDMDVTLGTFSASSFLRAFALDYPLAPVPSGEIEAGAFQIDELLVTKDPELQPIAIEPRLLRAPAGFTADGDPTVTIEGLAPALAAAVPVGAGKAFFNAGEWSLLAAYPGVVDGEVAMPGDDMLGDLVERGALEADLFLRADLVDVDGNRVGARPRFSLAPAVPAVIEPPVLPALVAPAPGGMTGGAAYVIDVDQADASVAGLYAVTLLDPSGRRWRLWRAEPAGGGALVSIRVPDVTLLGGSPLADGQIGCSVSFYSWPAFDPELFLWTDVEREAARFAHFNPSLADSFTQN